VHQEFLISDGAVLIRCEMCGYILKTTDIILPKLEAIVEVKHLPTDSVIRDK
jgi:hypothetical protein